MPCRILNRTADNCLIKNSDVLNLISSYLQLSLITRAFYMLIVKFEYRVIAIIHPLLLPNIIMKHHGRQICRLFFSDSYMFFKC